MATPRVGKSLEALAVKRTTLADADKVRYRVYSSETEFVAVIAESALMAMKLAEIPTPHRIVRDLPHEQLAIEAQRIAQAEEQRVMLSMKPKERTAQKAEMPRPEDRVRPDFVPMQAKDFQAQKKSWARVLTPEMVEQAQARAAAAKTPESAPSSPVAPVPVMEPAPAPIPESSPAPEAAQSAAPTEDGVLSEEEVQKLLSS